MTLKTTSTLLFLVVICSCNSKGNSDFKASIAINESSKNIIIDELELEKVLLDTVETSFTGFFHTQNNTIRYLDRRFGWLFIFDEDGRYLRKEFGRGDGPGEIPSFDVSFLDIKEDGGYFFLGGSWDGYNFSQDRELENKFQIEWLDGVSDQKKMEKYPDPSNSRLYAFDYDQDIVVSSEYFYIPLQSQYINFNLTHDDYFNYGRTLAKVRIKDGEMTEILGRRSDIYKSQKKLRLKSSIIIDAHPQGLMYTFETDSSIYIMDERENAVSVFGYPGKDMNMAYPRLEQTKTVEDMMEVGNFWRRSRNENGFYTSIKHIPSRDLTIRTYQKGDNNDNDGLQIYKKNVLIGDVEVPKGFKVKGYIAPYFYSDVITQEDEVLLKTYKFTINENPDL